MALCYNCGTEVPEDADICLNCGCALDGGKGGAAGSAKTAAAGRGQGAGKQAQKPLIKGAAAKKEASTDISRIAKPAAGKSSDPAQTEGDTEESAPVDRKKKPGRVRRGGITDVFRTPGFWLLAGIVLLVPALVLPWFTFDGDRTIEVFSIPFVFIFADKLDFLPQLSTGIVLCAVFAAGFFLALARRGMGVLILQLLAFFSVVVSIGALLMGFRFVNAEIELGPGYNTYVEERVTLMPEINMFRITPPSPTDAAEAYDAETMGRVSVLGHLLEVLGPGVFFPFLSGVIILWASMAYAPVMDQRGFRLTPLYAAIAAVALVAPGFLFLFPRVSPATWYNFQAAMLLRVNRIEQAEQKLEACVNLPAPHATCELGLARIYWQTGRGKEAMPLYTKIAAKQPGIPETHRDLGDIYFKGANYWKAAEEYRKYLELRPGDKKYKKKLSDSLVLVGNDNYSAGKLETALRLYNEALDLLPANRDDIVLQYKIGDIYYQLGRKEESLEHFKITADLQPGDFEQQDLVAKVYEEIGEYENAIIYYKKSIEIKPDNTMSYVHIGDIYKDRWDDVDNAIKWYKNAIDADLYSRGADVARKRLRALGIEYKR